MDPAILGVMFLLGLLLGFVGLAGAGLAATVLIVLFSVPVHISFATALGAVFVSSATGGWSHLREGNVEPIIGVQVGVVGMLGAFIGGTLALMTGGAELKTFAGLALVLNAVVLYVRTRMPTEGLRGADKESMSRWWWRELPGSAAIGLVCGMFTGFLSIGAAPWVQVGLMTVKGTSLRVTIGTTMVAVALMSLTAAARFAMGGQFAPWLLATVILGLATGSFIGAKLTRRAPRTLIRSVLIVTPVVAGAALLFGPGGG